MNIKLMQGLAGVNDCLREIFDLKQKIDAIHATAENQINMLKDKAVRESLPLAERVQKLEDVISVFIDANRQDILGKKRSVKLNFGVIGFRATSKLVIKNAQATIAKIREHFGRRAKDVIIVKESPNKNTLDKWNDADLKKIGAQRKTEDVFYYELNEAELKAL